MTSHYDPVRKCRVGMMDEAQFYEEAEASSGAYFKALVAAWQKGGGTLQWGAGGVGLRTALAGKPVGVCFLAPAFAGKKDRIELGLTTLAKQIGAARCETLEADLQKAAGDALKGTSMVSIVTPGDLPPASQKLLTSALTKLL